MAREDAVAGELLGCRERTRGEHFRGVPITSFLSRLCHPERRLPCPKVAALGVEGPLLSHMPRDRKTYSVYIMSSLSGTLYIGMTGNLRKRVFEHKFHRFEGFTDKYQIERLLYRESFDDVQRAINREKQLKGWRRSKKIALIEFLNPNWLDLARYWYPWMTHIPIAMSS